MIKQVHSRHLGIESCLKQSRDVLFWPGMTAEIKDCVSKCETCNTYQTNQQKDHSYLMIHLNALGLMLQKTFSVLTTRSGSLSSTTGQITLNWTNYPVPTQVLLSSLSRTSSHAMAYLILCIMTTDHSLLPGSSKNLHPPGTLTTKRPHHTIHNPLARFKML